MDFAHTEQWRAFGLMTVVGHRGMLNITGFDSLYLIPPYVFSEPASADMWFQGAGYARSWEKRVKPHGKFGVLHSESEGKKGFEPCSLSGPATCSMSILWGPRGHKIDSPYPLGSFQRVSICGSTYVCARQGTRWLLGLLLSILIPIIFGRRKTRKRDTPCTDLTLCRLGS
jgi:hypothetical protein